MDEEEYFTRERAMNLVKLMISQLEEDNMTQALRDVLTGANSHGIYHAKFALDKALEDMEKMELIDNYKREDK